MKTLISHLLLVTLVIATISTVFSAPLSDYDLFDSSSMENYQPLGPQVIIPQHHILHKKWSRLEPSIRYFKRSAKTSPFELGEEVVLIPINNLGDI